MLLVEFSKEISKGLNILKYRHINEIDWNYLKIDLETLNILLANYGIVSTTIYPKDNIERYNIDNITTGRDIYVKYCGAEIKLHCGFNDKNFNWALLEQSW